MNEKMETLICWHSKNHDVDVLTGAISLLREKHVFIGHVLYLVQSGMEAGVPDSLDGARVERLEVSISDPTDHKQIYDYLKERVLPKLEGLKGGLHINISPGTPAMHAVWLMLHAGGRFPEGTELWSSQVDGGSRRARIDKVEFPISTYMSEIQEVSKSHPDLAVYEVEPRSMARRKMLENLKRYALIQGEPLLILGERGTGKTRLVETYVSRIKGRPKVVTVACGELDSEIAESLLFGHKKGAFTGASTDRKGSLFEADKGILFLDEVQDLPKTMQRKLLRVFQDRRRRHRRLGEDKEREVDVELVCASNMSMDELRRRLDADFFDRINRLLVRVPPLRECREDLRGDWSEVWKEFRQGRQLPREAPWSKDLEDGLDDHPLHGNMRELQQISAYLVAWWSDSRNSDEAIRHALNEWRVNGALQTLEFNGLGHGSRDDRIKQFCQSLARWAKAQYGTWKDAASALHCNEKTLREDAK